MKKIFFTSLAGIVFAIPLWASGIAADATGSTCTNSVLETYDGDVNLQAAWEPNTIQIKWYNGDDEITPANSVATSCEYDDILTIPSNPPSKTGYTFIGWELRNETCGIENLDVSKNGSAYAFTRLDGDAGNNESNYGLTVGSGQWATEFDYGTVWGMARCSSTSGNNSDFTFPSNSQSDWLKEVPNDNGRYCWCQVTGFSAFRNNYTSGPQCTVSPTSSLLGFSYDYESFNNCASLCAHSCANRVRLAAAFRAGVFSSIGQ